MKNRKDLYLLLTIFTITFFAVIYSLASYVNNNDLVLQTSNKLPYLKLTERNVNDNEKNNLMQASVITNLAVVTENTKFVFKIRYKDNEVRNMVLEKHYNGSKFLNKKTETQLNDLFKNQGYTVSNMSDDEIVFVNNSDRYSYSANRYYLGVYGDLVTIYKTDKNGDITAQKLFNSNVYGEDGKQKQYNFEERDNGELQYIRLNDLKEKDGLVEDLIRGRKYVKDSNSSNDLESDIEYEKGEFKTPEKAFDYARGLLKS